MRLKQLSEFLGEDTWHAAFQEGLERIDSACKLDFEGVEYQTKLTLASQCVLSKMKRQEVRIQP